MRAAQLLAIDVSSELKTLCESQVRGSWQIPAELVRLGLAQGASGISAERRRRGFSLRWAGAPVTVEVLRLLLAALDKKRADEERHRAIVDLEAAQAQALLWAAGLSDAVLLLRVLDGRHRLSFECRRGSPPKLASAGVSGGEQGVEIRWSCAGLDADRAVRWLWSATRFAATTVMINGRPAARGFPNGLYRLHLEKPVPCDLGLTRTGDDPLLWLLRDGVVSARATIPGYPAFQAAVELGRVVPRDASAADLRRAVKPYLDDLIDRAVWMMLQVAGRFADTTEEDRRRLRTLVLRAAGRGLRKDEVRGVPLLPRVGPGMPLMSLVELAGLALGRGPLLLAVDPEDDADDFLVDPEVTLQVSEEERSLLSSLIGVRFQAPARRRIGVVRRWRGRLRVAVGVAARWVRGLFGSRPLPDSALSSEERRLLAAIRLAASSERIHLAAGGGEVRRTWRGLVVPREHTAVVAGAPLVAGDLRWLYPVLLAAKIGPPPPPEVREQWRRIVLGNEMASATPEAF